MIVRLCLRPLSLVLLSASALFMAACSSQRVADEASLAEAKKVPPPTMAAEHQFFDGAVLVEVNLGRGFRARMVKPGWKPRDGNAFGTTIYADEAAREAAEEEESELFIPRMRNSTLPPVALRLRVTNLGTAPIEIGFVECKSYLGNFAVRPEKITIAPGESGQPDPMVSLLGVSGEEIPVTITLLLGGKRETQTIIMVPIKQAPATPTAPAKP
ncbi:MAG: hypothetical protein QM760_12820 [Nibricoccus sp.]